MANLTPVLVASLFASLLTFAGPAAATPPSGGAGPQEEACAGLAAGDECVLPNNQQGTCATGTCSRLDYSGGSPPKAIEEACVVCKGQQAGPPMLGGDSGGGSSETPAGGEGGGAEAGGSADNDAKASAEGKEPPESSSRCSVEDDSPSPAGLALFIGLLLFVRQRQPRRT